MPGEPLFCDDCGEAAVGAYQFFYPNPSSDGATTPGPGARWSPTRAVCLRHKRAREQAGHRSRVPVEESEGNAPDPPQGTQAPDFDTNPAGKGATAPPAPPAA